jgi:hypothetical protein
MPSLHRGQQRLDLLPKLSPPHPRRLLTLGGRYVEGARPSHRRPRLLRAHVENDKAITHQHYYDQLELCSQIGLPDVSEPVA